jgi:hypothetical protein
VNAPAAQRGEDFGARIGGREGVPRGGNSFGEEKVGTLREKGIPREIAFGEVLGGLIDGRYVRDGGAADIDRAPAPSPLVTMKKISVEGRQKL